MTTIGFLIAIIVIILLFCISMLKRDKEDKTYPPYYEDVWITFRFPKEKCYYTKLGWLSVNDDGKLIWTLSKSNIIIEDDWVIEWKNCE